MSNKIIWSYSSLSLFQQCPKKYYHLRVSKNVKEPETQQILYGKKLHEAAEFYVGKGTALPPEFEFVKPHLDKLKELGDTHLCEYKMGLTRNLEACGFFDKDVWWRGVADLVVINGDMAYVIDYKTGKSSRYADTKQLEIRSLALFKHCPEVKRIKAGLLFVVANDFVRAEYDTSAPETYWVKWLNETKALEAAYENNVWNAKPNFSCKQYCSVIECPHNGKNH